MAPTDAILLAGSLAVLVAFARLIRRTWLRHLRDPSAYPATREGRLDWAKHCERFRSN